jgi:hypothetical protein
MDLALMPDTYSPGVDDNGNYVDVLPSSIVHGLYCLCGSRKDKSYATMQKFTAHIKTTKHKQWINNLNLSKANYYVEMIKYKDLVDVQKKQIINLENKNSRSMSTIKSLTDQLLDYDTPDSGRTSSSTDLLGIN